MGRPKSPLTNLTPPARGRPPIVGGPREAVSFRLPAEDVAKLDAIAAEVATRGRGEPNRTRALRWAIRELFARLYLGRAARAAGDAVNVTPIGPATVPPDP